MQEMYLEDNALQFRYLWINVIFGIYIQETDYHECRY
jgi:hypothetical protein